MMTKNAGRAAAVIAAVGLLVYGCGMSKSSTAPSPTYSKSEIAPTVGQLVATSITRLFRAAGGQSAAALMRPPVLARVLSLVSSAVSAQAGTWTYTCPSGGTATMLLPPFIGHTTVTSVPVTYGACATAYQSAKVTTNGTPVVNGTFWTTDPNNTSIRVTGDINVDCSGCEPFIGATPLDGTVGGNEAYSGLVGGTPVTTTPTPAPSPSCTATLSATVFNAPAAGGAFNVNITVGTTCTWLAGSLSNFITLTGASNGTGNGATSFSVAANTGTARVGTLNIAGAIVTVNQAAGVTPTPTPSEGFNGTWTGQYDSGEIRQRLPGGLPDQVDSLVGAPVSVVIANNAISGSGFLCDTWTGSISSNGSAQFRGTGRIGIGTFTCSVTATFQVSGSSGSASGTSSEIGRIDGIPDSDYLLTATGSWRMTRQP